MEQIGIRAKHFMLPTKIAVEASLDVIATFDLDQRTGEHYSHIDGVISIEVNGDTISITTVRTYEAWRRGEPNAGRTVYEVPRDSVANIWA